jgi:hypothetical protein
MIEITDVKETKHEVVRLKANGHQMVLEEMALEVLADVLRSDTIEEMIANASSRLMPDWDDARWRAFFEKHTER